MRSNRPLKLAHVGVTSFAKARSAPLWPAAYRQGVTQHGRRVVFNDLRDP
jgi:hypothetical protein